MRHERGIDVAVLDAIALVPLKGQPNAILPAHLLVAITENNETNKRRQRCGVSGLASSLAKLFSVHGTAVTSSRQPSSWSLEESMW